MHYFEMLLSKAEFQAVFVYSATKYICVSPLVAELQDIGLGCTSGSSPPRG